MMNASSRSGRKEGSFSSRAALAAALGALPVAVLLVDIPPDVLAGCGYECGEPACFSVEISTNYGYTWQTGSAWVYGEQGATVDLYLRVTLTTSVGQVQGWSFGLAHEAPGLIGVDGGDFVLRAGEAGPGVDTVQAGNPPDFEATTVWDCGLTQGVAIDYNSTGHTLGATTDRVIAHACYRLTIPENPWVHEVKLDFKDVVGNPPVRNLVAREGSPLGLCKGALTINVQASEYYSTPSYCPCDPSEPWQCEPEEGGGERLLAGGDPGMDFRRGDSNTDSHVDLSDAVFLLNHLFLGGTEPDCLDAADTNDDEFLDITDAIHLLNYLFLGGPSPPMPGPDTCGPDVTAPDGRDPLNCLSYAHCDQTDSDGDGLTDFFEENFRLVEGEPLAPLDPDNPDTDGDKFTDGQEVLPHLPVPGTSAGKGFVISVVNGIRRADPHVKDIFVEIDYMIGPGGHTHRPAFTALKPLIDTFAAHGINLHLDVGIPSQNWGELFNLGNIDHEVPEVTPMRLGDSSWDDIYATHFDKSNRFHVFHYCLIGHENSRGDRITGEAQLPGRNMFLTLYLHPFDDFSVGINLMHELGHNLNLCHGGDEACHGQAAGGQWAYKPNYRSVMCYLYSQDGIDTDGDAMPDGVIDYSDEVLDDLDERDLNEHVGIVGLPIDWNCNAQIEASVRVDLQCPDRAICECSGERRQLLRSFNDWENLKLFMNPPAQPGGGGGGEVGEIVSCGPEE